MIRVALHAGSLPHHRQQMDMLGEGLRKHGIATIYAPFNVPHISCDFAVIWGWRQPAVVHAARAVGKPVLVMERATLGDREAMTSLGWNGLAGRGSYPQIDDGGKRWGSLGIDLMPWRKNVGYALIIGQVNGDASITGMDFKQWVQRVANDLLASPYRPVWYRPHPISLARGNRWYPKGTKLADDERALKDDLDGAMIAVSYNSTAGVEAVCRGVPTVASDPGSMAWPVAAHSLDDWLFSATRVRFTPDREPWAHRLAWTQWHPHEMRDGSAWDALRTVKGIAHELADERKQPA